MIELRKLLHPSYFYPRSPCGERRCLRCCAISCITISIHALLAESDRRRGVLRYLDNIISIHALLAESDIGANNHIRICKNFYPRSPCGERHQTCYQYQKDYRFLSTLSLRRATVVDTVKLAGPVLFLSTLSLRRATSNFTQKDHPPHNFYPRSPCGERPGNTRNSAETA